MELETISSVNSNYSAAEVTKVSTPKRVEKVQVSMPETSAASAVTAAGQNMTVEGKGSAGQQGGGQQNGEHAASEASINDAVSKANRKMTHTRCEYAYHKETKRVSIKVFDADTDEVIREIPPEKSLDMLQKMWEMAGILVDERR